MSRYKGRPNTKAVERDFPHVIEMAVPPSPGFGNQLNAMCDWHIARGIDERRGRGRYEEPTWYVRWCFADRATAEAFQAEFGGQAILPPMPKHDAIAAREWTRKFIQD